MKTLAQLARAREAAIRAQERIEAQMQRAIAQEARKALMLQRKLDATKDSINAALRAIHPNENWTAEDIITRAGQEHINQVLREHDARKAYAIKAPVGESVVVEPSPMRVYGDETQNTSILRRRKGPVSQEARPVTPEEQAKAKAFLEGYIFEGFLSSKGAEWLKNIRSNIDKGWPISEDDGHLMEYLKTF